MAQHTPFRTDGVFIALEDTGVLNGWPVTLLTNVAFALVPDDKRAPEPGGTGIPDERADLHRLRPCDHPNYRQSEGAGGHPLWRCCEVECVWGSEHSPLIVSPGLPVLCAKVALCSPFTFVSLQGGALSCLITLAACCAFEEVHQPPDPRSQLPAPPCLQLCLHRAGLRDAGHTDPVSCTMSVLMRLWGPAWPWVSVPGVLFASVRAVCC